MKTLKQILDYWRDPKDRNHPYYYLDAESKRSMMLVDIMKRFASPEDTILELGCNVGRNLAFLHRAGFHRLSGLDINRKALELAPLVYPELENTALFCGAIEEILTDKPPCFYNSDVIFTMATLEHIHPSSEWVFEEIARRCKVLITIEDEVTKSERHFPRNYKTVFEGLGLCQVYGRKNLLGPSRSFRARVFKGGGD